MRTHAREFRSDGGTEYPRVRMRPEVLRGAGHMGKTRVLELVRRSREGRAPEQLAADFGLTLGQVHAGLAYYFDHPAEFRPLGAG